MTDEEAATKKEKKNGVRWYTWAGSAVGIIVAALLVLHFTPLHYWQDPLESAQEYVQVKSARTDIERANVHLSLAERHYQYFVALQKKSPRSSELTKQLNKMVGHDDVAMVYMDNAKRANLNIRALVKRLCDDLDNQYASIKSANTASAEHVEDMSKYAWDLESSIDSTGKFNQQLYEIRLGLDKAMSW